MVCAIQNPPVYENTTHYMLIKDWQMTKEEELIALNKELAKYRAAGDTDSYIIAQAKKESIIAKMGAEAEEEYIKIYGK